MLYLLYFQYKAFKIKRSSKINTFKKNKRLHRLGRSSYILYKPVKRPSNTYSSSASYC